MKNKIGITASLLALSGCSMLQSVGSAVVGDLGAFAERNEKNQRFCDNLNDYKGAKDGIPNYNLRDKNEVDNLDMVFERAEACRSWYASLAGLVVVSDTANSTLASAGGVGLLAYGGAAAASTNLFLATLTVAPSIISEVTRQEPQGVLANQAAEATTLAECQMLRVREGLFDLLDERAALQEAVQLARDERSELSSAINRLTSELQSRAANASVAGAAAKGEEEKAPTVNAPTFGELVARDGELRALVQLARRYDDLISAGGDLITQIDMRTGYEEPDRDVGDALQVVELFKAAKAENVAKLVRAADRDAIAELVVRADSAMVAALFAAAGGNSVDELFVLGDPALVAEPRRKSDLAQLALLVREADPVKLANLFSRSDPDRIRNLLVTTDPHFLARFVSDVDPGDIADLIKDVGPVMVADLMLQNSPKDAALVDAQARINEKLALDLNTKLDSINLIWNQNFRQLTPKPEASLRSVLAAPFSITAKLISGEQTQPGNAADVAKATYDFSASYGAHGIEAFASPTIVVAVDKMLVHPVRWGDVDNSLDSMKRLSSAMAQANALLNGVAEVDAQSASGFCRVSPSKAIGASPQSTPVPQAAPAPSQPVLIKISD